LSLCASSAERISFMSQCSRLMQRMTPSEVLRSAM
jgi:hypothetical protein